MDMSSFIYETGMFKSLVNMICQGTCSARNYDLNKFVDDFNPRYDIFYEHDLEPLTSKRYGEGKRGT